MISIFLTLVTPSGSIKKPVVDSKKEEQPVCLFLHLCVVENYHLSTGTQAWVIWCDHEILVMLIFLLSHTILFSHCLPAALNKTKPCLTALRLRWTLRLRWIGSGLSPLSRQWSLRYICSCLASGCVATLYCTHCAFFIVPGGTAKNTGSESCSFHILPINVPIDGLQGPFWSYLQPNSETQCKSADMVLSRSIS